MELLDRMDLFGPKELEKIISNRTKEKPKRETYSNDFKRKVVALASKTNNSNVAKELGISPSSISNWKKSFVNTVLDYDLKGNLTFSLDNHTYTLNVNSEEERNIILAKVNSNSEYIWDWFKETTGKEHWVLYNTEMYEVLGSEYLHYRENPNLAPVLPINATSCCSMFAHCDALITLDLSDFYTSGVIEMEDMFSHCSSLINLDVTKFNTSNVIDMSFMFEGCKSLISLDLSNFITSKVIDMPFAFAGCKSLVSLDLSNFNISDVKEMEDIFFDCTSLKTIKTSDTELVNHIRKHYPQIQIA